MSSPWLQFPPLSNSIWIRTTVEALAVAALGGLMGLGWARLEELVRKRRSGGWRQRW